MPVDIEPRRTRSMQPRTSVGQRGLRAALRIGLINNMPDAALQSTEAQFVGLLKGAAGSQPVTVRLSSFPELPRSAEALAQIGCLLVPRGAPGRAPRRPHRHGHRAHGAASDR